MPLKPDTTASQAVAVAEDAEYLAETGQPDSFPPEGTDDKLFAPPDAKAGDLTQADRLKATRAAIAAEGTGHRAKT